MVRDTGGNNIYQCFNDIKLRNMKNLENSIACLLEFP